MTGTMLESGAVSVYCESVAVMLSAGIHTEEAVSLLADNMHDETFKSACNEVYKGLLERKTLADAMEGTGRFPRYAVDMTRTGETSGRLETTMAALAEYYDEEDRLISKLHSAILYPVILFALISVILLFTVAVILPVFLNVYQEMSGNLSAGSYSFVNASIAIGWVAFAFSAACTIAIFIVAAMSRSQNNLPALERLLEKLPMTRTAAHQMALARFTSILTSYIATGESVDRAVANAARTVEARKLRARLEKALAEMNDLENPKSLSEALYNNDIYGPVYTRMLMIGATSGSLEAILDRLSTAFFEDALVQMDESLDGIEPTLAAFLTLTVGATLIAVMLPLIGILGSIG